MKMLLRITAVLALCLLILGVAVMTLPDRYISSLAVKAVAALTGRVLHVGTLTLERDLSPRLTLTDVAFANPAWADNEQLFEAASVDATFDLPSMLRGRLHILSFSTRGARLNLESNAAGEASWPFTSSEPYAIDLERLRLDHADLSDIRIGYTDAAQDRQHELALKHATLSTAETASAATLEATGTVDGLPIGPLGLTARLTGRLSASASPGGRDRRYDIDLHAAELSSDVVDATLAGTVEDILGTARVALDVSAQLADLSIVTALSGQKMPPEWGPISAYAVLEGESGHYALNQIEATLDGVSTARATGTIESLVPFEGMRLDAEANLATLAEISTFTPRPLPEIGPVTGTGIVSWQDGRLSLTDAHATHRSRYGTTVVTGAIADLIHFDGVRLRADADLPDFSVLELFTGVEFPRVDHVVASANLVSIDALDLSARQLRVSATRDDVEVTGVGSVDSIFQGGAVLDLDLKSGVDSLARLDTLLGTALPDVGPLMATARLAGAKQEIALSEVRATLSDKALAAMARPAAGKPLRVADLSLDGLAFDVELSTPSMRQAARRFGMTSVITAPASATGRVLSSDGTLRFADTQLDIGSSHLQGELTLRHLGDPGRKPALEGDVTVAKLDLLELLDAPVGLRQSEAEVSRNDGRTDQRSEDQSLLSDRSLPLAEIGAEDIKLTLAIRELRSALFDVSDSTLQVAVNQGVITIGPFAGVVNEGQATLDLAIDTTTAPPAVKIDLDLDEIDLSRAGWLKGSDLIKNSGGAWLRLSITGQGDSLAQILASADGEGGLYIEELLIQENALSLFSSDLLEQLADALNPFEERPAQTRIRCTAMTFQIKAGQLETPFGLAVDSDNFVIVGDADLDLSNERVEVEFDTRPKRGLGIGLNRVTNLVKLEGPLSSPALSLSGSGLLEFGASLAAAIASSGVTLLAEGLYEKHQANSGVCTRALGQ